MNKASKITLVFVLIFVVGVLLLVTSINHSLNDPSHSSLEREGFFSNK